MKSLEGGIAVGGRKFGQRRTDGRGHRSGLIAGDGGYVASGCW